MASVENKSLCDERILVRQECAETTPFSNMPQPSGSFRGSEEGKLLLVSFEEYGDDRLASPINSMGVAFEPDCELVTSFVEVPCHHVDDYTEVTGGRIHEFIIRTPPESQEDDELFYLAQPRAGGVRPPTTVNSLHSGLSDRQGSRCSSVDNLRLHQSPFVRLWSHSSDLAVFDESAQTAETYLRSRLCRSSVFPRPASSSGNRSHGSRSSQFWRGEAIEEALTPCLSPSGSLAQNKVLKWTSECGPLSQAEWSLSHSGRISGGMGKVSALLGSMRLTDSASGTPREETNLPSSRKGGTRKTSADMESFLSAPNMLGESEPSVKILLERIAYVEERIQEMEKTLMYVIERLETRQVEMEQYMKDLKCSSLLVRLPTTQSPHNEVSASATREPSYTVDCLINDESIQSEKGE